MTTPRDRHRGFSLTELLVALVISSVVIAGALGLLVSQQHAFRSTSGDRALQEAARIALGNIAESLRAAGFGVDPALVFDFGPMQNVRMAELPAGTTFSTNSYLCGAAVACRDQTATTDEIVFFSRDPAFGHALLAPATAASLTIQGPLNVPLHQGQVLQVMCFSGDMAWAYVTVNAEVPATTATTVQVPITSGAGFTFPQQNVAADGCFGAFALPLGSGLDPNSLQSATKVYKVDRYRYHVSAFPDRPYLMLDQGLLDANGNAIDNVVAPDVEDLQFAYVFPNDPVNTIVGTVPGTQIPASTTGIDLAPAAGCPAYGDAPNAPQRLTHHPGNIMAVQVSLVVRSPEPDVTLAGSDQVPAAANHVQQNPGFYAGPLGYRRLLVQATVYLRNLEATAPYYPTYGTAGTQLNLGGG